MKSAYRIAQVALLGLVVTLSVGCRNRDQKNGTKTTNSVSGESFLLDAEAFNLQYVIGLIRDGKLKNAEELEATVNDPSTGINNVDVDGDGQVDYISAQEVQSAGGKQFEFVANPKTGEPVVVATAGFERSTDGQVAVTGGYPNYVNGYHDHYYHHMMAYHASHAFLYWMFMPRPMFMARPAFIAAYRPYGVMNQRQLSQTRTTQSQKTKVTPTKASKPPKNYKGAKPSKKMPSSYKGKMKKPSGNSVKDRGNKANDYRKNNSPKTKGGGMKRPNGDKTRVKPDAPRRSTPSTKPSTPRKSRPSTRPSRPSYRPRGGSRSRGGRRR